MKAFAFLMFLMVLVLSTFVAGAQSNETETKLSDCLANCPNACDKFHVAWVEKTNARYIATRKLMCRVTCSVEQQKPGHKVTPGIRDYCWFLATQSKFPALFPYCIGEKEAAKCLFFCEALVDREKKYAEQGLMRCLYQCNQNCKQQHKEQQYETIPKKSLPKTDPVTPPRMPRPTWGAAPGFPGGYYGNSGPRGTICITDQYGTDCNPAQFE